MTAQNDVKLPSWLDKVKWDANGLVPVIAQEASSNDVLMFAHSGLSIAMGNASPEVQRAARRVTSSNSDEGFASAVENFILGKSAAGPGPQA